MIFFLAKFFREKEHANDFIRGQLFANRISYFKRIEGHDGRGDEDEGAIMSKNDGLTLELTATDVETGEVVSKHTLYGTELAAPLILRPERFDHVNVFCMYAGHSGGFQSISADNAQDLKKQLEIPKACTALGKYAVVITNTVEFIRRVEVAAERKGYGICKGLVKYYDPEVGTPPVRSEIETIFTKRKEYEYQSEFRFAVNTRTMGCDPITLDVGEIDDITVCLDTSDINLQLSVRIEGDPGDCIGD